MSLASRRSVAFAGAIAMVTALTGPTAAYATVVAPFGTAPVTIAHAPVTQPVVTGIRSARHTTFDRLVIQFAGSLPGYDIRYVPHLVQDGSGKTVSLAGARDLRIRLDGAVAHTDAGTSSLLTPRHRLTLLPALREWKLIGDFEGIVTVGAGVSDTLAFRVTELSGPTRLVVDIRHPLPRPTSTADRSAPGTSTVAAHLTGIAISTHPTYDRVVFTFRGPAPGYHVGYVPVVYADGSGAPVTLAGNAFLAVSFTPADLHLANGSATYLGPRQLSRTGEIRQLKLTGDFEAVLSAGIGVHTKLGFRVLRLSSPTRVVIDIAR